MVPLVNILYLYLSGPTISVKSFTATLYGPMTLYQMTDMSERILSKAERVHLRFSKEHDTLSYPHMIHLTRSKTLTELIIKHPKFLSLTRTEFAAVFESCKSLKRLCLAQEGPEPRARFLKEELPPGRTRLDMSCLDILAEALPHLECLELSVLACDTSELKPDRLLTPFKALHGLIFASFSLWNWHSVLGFEQHEAARYISALLRSHGRFDCVPVAGAGVTGELLEHTEQL